MSSAETPIELQLCALLCRVPLSDSQRSRIHALLDQQPEWDKLLRAAIFWEVEPTVLSNLRGNFLDAIPAHHVQPIVDKERDVRSRALAKGLMTVEVACAVEELGIPVIVMKGPAIGLRAYDDASLRNFVDVDLLVKAQDLVRAANALVQIGYERDYERAIERQLIRDGHALELSTPRNKVEIHGALMSRHLRMRFDDAKIWESAQSMTLGGKSFKAMASHHLFLFLTAHGAKHRWSNVRWLCDLAQLHERMDANDVAKVLELSARMHVQTLLSLGVRAARDILGADMRQFPESVLVDPRETADLLRVVRERIYTGNSRSSDWTQWLTRIDPAMGPLIFWSKSRERFVDRYAGVVRLVFVPTARDPGPRALQWATRPLRLIARAVTEFWSR